MLKPGGSCMSMVFEGLKGGWSIPQSTSVSIYPLHFG